MNTRSGTVIHESKTSIVVDYGSYIAKRYKYFDYATMACELSMLNSSMEDSMRVTLRVNYDNEAGTLSSYMKKGYPVGDVGDDDIKDLIRHLAVMESHGIIHGDIKASNIVRVNGKLRMIDYEILSTRFENSCSLQTYKDEYGACFMKGAVTSQYTAISQAMYALGLVIALFKGVIPPHLLGTSTAVEKIKVIVTGGVELSVTVGEYVVFVKENIDSLCDKLPILSLLLREPSLRAGSFWQLLKDDTTRDIYDRCAREDMTCKQTAQAIEGYFRTGKIDEWDLVIATNGSCFFGLEEENYTLRLLREYHEPGSWYLPCGKCHSIAELREHFCESSPLIVVCCFEGSRTSYIRPSSLL